MIYQNAQGPGGNGNQGPRTTHKEIALARGRSLNTVKKQLGDIRERAGVSNLPELAHQYTLYRSHRERILRLREQQKK